MSPMTKRKLAHRAVVAVIDGVVVKNRIGRTDDPALATLARAKRDLFIFDFEGMKALMKKTGNRRR